jgi:hypothetical protein
MAQVVSIALLLSTQLSSRAPSGTRYCAPLLSWKDQSQRGRYRSPARRAGAILRPTTNTTPPPSSTSIRAVTPAASATAADGQPRRARARPRRRAQRVESDVGDRPQPTRGTPSSARRPHRLAHRLARALLRRPADTRNGVRPGVQLCPTACPTGPELPMAKPNRAGIIIRRSQVRVLSPASKPPGHWLAEPPFSDTPSPGADGLSDRTNNRTAQIAPCVQPRVQRVAPAAVASYLAFPAASDRRSRSLPTRASAWRRLIAIGRQNSSPPSRLP